MLKYFTLALFVTMAGIAQAETLMDLPKETLVDIPQFKAKVVFTSPTVVSNPMGIIPNDYDAAKDIKGHWIASHGDVISFPLMGPGYKHLHGLCSIYSASRNGLSVDKGSVWIFSQKFFYDSNDERNWNLPTEPASTIVWKLQQGEGSNVGGPVIYLSCTKHETFKMWPTLFDLNDAAFNRTLPLELRYTIP